MVNKSIFNEVVDQVSKLLVSRGKEIEKYLFENAHKNYINVYINYKKITTIHLYKFNQVDIIRNSSQWKKYKTYLLNQIDFISPDFIESDQYDISPDVVDGQQNNSESESLKYSSEENYFDEIDENVNY